MLIILSYWKKRKNSDLRALFKKKVLWRERWINIYTHTNVGLILYIYIFIYLRGGNKLKAVLAMGFAQ